MATLFSMATVCTFRLVGLTKSAEFHQAKHVLKKLCENFPDQLLFDAGDCVGMMEYQWIEYVEQLRKSESREMRGFEGQAAVFCNDQLIGATESLLNWAAHKYYFHDDQLLETYQFEAQAAYSEYLSNPDRTYVFMDTCIDGELIGRMVFELFTNVCPQTCANFISLCTGEKGHSHTTKTRLSYVNSIFHRVVSNGWVQGGDICESNGAGGESIFGKTFPDESFAVSHANESGIVGMVNHGRNTNNSQFYITLKPSPWMDKQYVAFGRLIEGKNVLRKLEQVESYNERPLKLCQVSNCGKFTPAGQQI